MKPLLLEETFATSSATFSLKEHSVYRNYDLRRRDRKEEKEEDDEEGEKKKKQTEFNHTFVDKVGLILDLAFIEYSTQIPIDTVEGVPRGVTVGPACPREADMKRL